MTIRTKWHLVKELVEKEQVYLTAPYKGSSHHYSEVGLKLDALKTMIDGCEDVPKFVFDKSLLDLVSQDEFYDSLVDMKQADVLKLPYDSVLIEFEDRHGNHYINLLFSPSNDYNDKTDPDDVQGVSMMICKDNHGPYLCVPYCLSTVSVGLGARDKLFRIGALRSKWFDRLPEIDKHIQDTYMKDGRNLGTGWTMTMLVMSTKGVQKETVNVDKLNKARAKSKKPSIPQHTYIRIGHVYNKDGSKTKFDERKSPRPHWRRGHSRRIKVGVGRSETKTVWIAPMLVAYHDGEDVFTPDYAVKK